MRKKFSVQGSACGSPVALDVTANRQEHQPLESVHHGSIKASAPEQMRLRYTNLFLISAKEALILDRHPSM